MDWKTWAIDAGLSTADLVCFIPVENPDDENPVFVFGMNIAAAPDDPPGKVVMIIHPDGNDAADAWLKTNKRTVERVREGMLRKGFTCPPKENKPV